MGEAGLYISFGEPREVLYPRMLRFGMDFQKYEDKSLFFVIEYQPHEVAKLMQEEGGTIYDIVHTYKIKRIVIDPITPYLSQFTSLYDARLALTRLFNVVRKWKATTLLINEKAGEGDRISQLAEFLADGVVNLIHIRNEDGVQVRGIEVWKLCGIDHTEVARPFAFTKKGIVVYPNERIFMRFEK
jgi:KaiC/GvpD/RAD55 family RecA-like ATPase